MSNKRPLIVAILFVFCFGALPVSLAEMGPGPGGECPMCPMGSGKHTMHHEKMGGLMEMLKETMDIVKNLSHVPSAAQKQKLTEMMGRLDEMIKAHDAMGEMGKRHESMKEGMKDRMKMHHERMGNLLTILRDTMGIVKDLAHQPSSAQKQNLTEMMNQLDEIIKEHDEMGEMKGM